ncbi:MAG: hypothetical protein R3E66_09250 [bacterium]
MGRRHGPEGPSPEDLQQTHIQGRENAPAALDVEISQTLPTGVPSAIADAVSPEVAMTHMAYKPTPMPESEPVYQPQPEPAYQPQSAPFSERSAPYEPAGYEPTPSPAATPYEEPKLSAPMPEPAASEMLPPVESDDDDDDEPFFEPFAIAELVEAPELQPKDAQTKPVVEIIRTAQGRALDIAVLNSPIRGYSRQQGTFKARMVGKSANVKLAKPLQGWIRRGRNPQEDLPPRYEDQPCSWRRG